MEIRDKLKEIRNNLEGVLFMEKFRKNLFFSSHKEIQKNIDSIKLIEAKMDIEKILGVTLK